MEVKRTFYAFFINIKMNNLDRAKTIKGFFDIFTEKGYTEELPMIIEWANDFKKDIISQLLKLHPLPETSEFLKNQEAIKELEQVK